MIKEVRFRTAEISAKAIERGKVDLLVTQNNHAVIIKLMQ